MSSTSCMCFCLINDGLALWTISAFTNRRAIFLPPFLLLCFFSLLSHFFFFSSFAHFLPSFTPKDSQTHINKTYIPFEHLLHNSYLVRQVAAECLLANYQWLGCDRCRHDGWQPVQRPRSGGSNSWPLESIGWRGKPLQYPGSVPPQDTGRDRQWRWKG